MNRRPLFANEMFRLQVGESHNKELLQVMEREHWNSVTRLPKSLDMSDVSESGLTYHLTKMDLDKTQHR